jgi:hypothetical protein
LSIRSAQFVSVAGTTQATLPAQSVSAQAFPSRPMRWIVAVPPGSTNDLISRLVAQRLAESVGQPVLVDNRPGGAFVIASDIIARSAPDGHTVGTLLTPHVVNPFVMKDLPYDTLRDFTPVSNMVIVPVGAGGQISLFNLSGQTDLVVDVNGYYGTAGAATVRLISLRSRRSLKTARQSRSPSTLATLHTSVALDEVSSNRPRSGFNIRKARKSPPFSCG